MNKENTILKYLALKESYFKLWPWKINQSVTKTPLK